MKPSETRAPAERHLMRRADLLFFLIPLGILISIAALAAAGRSNLGESDPGAAAAIVAAEPKLSPQLHESVTAALALEPADFGGDRTVADPFVDRLGTIPPPKSGPSRPRARTLPAPPRTEASAEANAPLVRDVDGRPLPPLAERMARWRERARDVAAQTGALPAFESVFSLTELELIGLAARDGLWLKVRASAPGGEPAPDEVFCVAPGTSFYDAVYLRFDATGRRAIFRTTGGKEVSLAVD